MTTIAKGLRRRLISGLLTAALLLAVPAGALFLMGSSATASDNPDPATNTGLSLEDEIKRQRESMIETLLSAANLPPDQQIAVKQQVRASDQGTINPSTPVFQRIQ